MWKRIVLTCVNLLGSALQIISQPLLPRPDHIVIALFENKGFSQIVGSANAPYINSLIADTNTALFTQSYALTHPSQPNYLMLFSGADQGVTGDTVPTATPFTSCNLGASLIQAGFTFTGYCEDMPAPGFLGTHNGLYYRRHNPWSNWQGSFSNDLDTFVNQPFTVFPANYNLLPDVSFVIPNINNSMHYGSVALGDSWLQFNLGSYIQWARTNNSLLILTFDEDDGSEGNRITTLFYGPMVSGGTYNTHITHYNVLRTLEEIYTLSYCGNSSSATPINYIWKSVFGVRENLTLRRSITVFPNPAQDHAALKVNIERNVRAMVAVTDICGKVLFKTECDLKPGENTIRLLPPFCAGVYTVDVTAQELHLTTKLLVD